MVFGRRGRRATKWTRALLAGLVLAKAGCEGHEPKADEASCSDDADCASDERCERSDGPSRRPAIALPCPTGLVKCTADAECPSGQKCDQASLDGKTDCGKACKLGCPDIPCGSLQTCENARCRTLQCDEPGGPACEARWRCDPAAALNEPPVSQGAPGDDSYTTFYISAGCVRVKCDEPSGYTCSDGWVCDPDNSSDGSGCRALPCAEGGGCSDDAAFICMPTSTNRRPAETDPHGCVRRNCEEGVTCTLLDASGTNVGVCDFSGPFADASGCTARPCESDAACASYEVCDPGSQSNIFGCRAKTCVDGLPCPAGSHCDPNATGTNRCVSDGTGGSSAGGSGGTSGGSGGASSGSAGETDPGPGRCVSD